MGREKGRRVGPVRKVRADDWAEAFDRLRYEKDLTLADIAERSRLSLRTLKYIAAHGVRARGARYAQTWTIRAIERALFGDEHAGAAGHSMSEAAQQVRDERAAAKVQSAGAGRKRRSKGARSTDLARLHFLRSSKVQRPAARRRRR